MCLTWRVLPKEPVFTSPACIATASYNTVEVFAVAEAARRFALGHAAFHGMLSGTAFWAAEYELPPTDSV